jgi:translocation and assembly module TamB
MAGRSGKVLAKIAKVFGWIIVSVICLLLVTIAVIQIPAVQSKITAKAVHYLENKLGTRVELQSLYISFPKNIVLKGLYLEDQQKDTLLYTGKLTIDTDLWGLTKNKIQLNSIDLENTTAFVKRADHDSAFNFTYILDKFAGDSTAVPDTLEQKGWDFNLEKIKLQDIHAHYHDQLTGNNADVDLGDFMLSMDEFDLKNYKFGIEDITLERTRIDVTQTKLPEVTQEVAKQSVDTVQLDLTFDKIRLNDVHANYHQSVTGQQIRADLGKFAVAANQINLKRNIIDLKDISLSNSFLAFHQLESQHRPTPQATGSSSTQTEAGSSSGKPVKKSTTKPWTIKVRSLSLDGNGIQYFDFTKPFDRRTMDFDHLWLSNITLQGRDLAMVGSTLAANIENLTLKERSGFGLHTLRGSIKVGEDSASIKDFLLITNNSKLQLNVRAGFDDINTIASSYPEATIRAEIRPSYLGIKDILLFNRHMLDSLPLKQSRFNRINFEALFTGKVNNLVINHLTLKALQETYLNANGRLVGLPDAKKLKASVALEKFYTTRNDIVSILPDTLLPDSIAPPNWINVTANFKGDAEKSEFKTVLSSPIGSVNAAGHVNLDSTSSSRGIDGKVEVNQFDLGYLLMKPKTIGKLDLLASINTNGLTKKEMTGRMNALVKSFEYEGYRYQNFKADAKIKNDVLSGKASLQDKNLSFTLDGDYDFSNDVPKYDFKFDLKNSDFQALHLSEKPLQARAILEVDLTTADFRVLNGDVGIRKVAIFNGQKLYAVDSLLFASIDQNGRSEIKINSDIMDGSFVGSINIFQMGAVMREYFNTYYSLHDSVKNSYEDPQHFKFKLDLKKTELITDILVPNLTAFEPGEIKGEFDSKRKRLDLRFDIDTIQYSKIGAKGFVFSTNSDSTNLNYNLFLNEITYDTLKIDGFEFNGTVSHDSLRTNIIILDSLDLYKYVMGGTFFSHDNNFELKLNPKEVRLNYEQWNIPWNNYIQFGGKKLIAQNVTLSNGDEKIIFESKPETGAPLFVGFRRLNIEYLVSMVSKKKLASGFLDGDINLQLDKKPSTFTSDIAIKDFALSDVRWGDIKLDVKQNVADRFDVDFSLLSDRNDLRANGYYTGGKKPSIEVNAKLNKFDLVSIQPLLAAQLKDLKGFLVGNMHVGGAPSKPSINGDITFKNTGFLSTYLNTAFTINDQTISFTDKGISFDDFKLIDTRKNPAKINGLIATTDYTKFNFNLDLVTNNFRVINTTAKENQLYYGLVDVNATAKIRGTLLSPEIDTEISLADGSKLTYVVPQSEAAILEQQGIVTFVDNSFKGDPFMKKIQKELPDTLTSKFTGVDLTAKIELDDKETFTIIIDPTTDDQLTIKGNTTLTQKIDPTGDIQLTGRYEISEGTYNLSFYKFLKRQFKIEKGSTITWSGDPLNADMDIHAIFDVETSPIDLLANQLQGMDRQEMNKYKQRLPFQVYLNITGELLKPEISFRLDMPMKERNSFGGNVYARLMDINTRESDLNKQVFALLILKRFISDNPFENQGATGFEGTARSSVSKILTEQLNRLSQNVKGVELSFDVKSFEDYSSGQAKGQTQLQLGLSKRLMNDRLVVKLSGNVDIEGQNTNRDATDYIGDLALEYLLTNDGRFRITGFRNSNYDMIDGELIETGAGVIYIKDYDTLNELFKSNAKRKK